MASNSTPHLKAVYVFQHTIYQEIIKSLHLYRLANNELQEVDRAYQFLTDGVKEIHANRFLDLEGFNVSEMVVGKLFDAWLCIYAFDADIPPHWLGIPFQLTCHAKLRAMESDLMNFALDTRLRSGELPILLNHEGVEVHQGNPLPSSELHGKHASSSQKLDIGCSKASEYEVNNGKSDAKENEHNANDSDSAKYQRGWDLNLPPSDTGGESEEKKQERKKKVSKDYVDSLTLEDLKKYFHLESFKAAAALNIASSTLKRKRSDLGIKQWPHYKLRVLDNLSRELQEEAEEGNVLPGSMTIREWQERVLREREEIMNNPSLELPEDIRKMYQLISQRRRRAKKSKGNAEHAA